MKKEVLLAITIGVVLGLIIMAGVKFDNLKNLTTAENSNSETLNTISPVPTITPTPTPEPTLTISILSPENESLIDTPTVELVGKTSPLSIVVIIAEEDEVILRSSEQGDFKTEVDLIGGENIIEITAYNNEGEEARTELMLTYTTADI